MTIAKLGRFKFSVEVAKQFDEELTKSKESGNGNKKSADINKKKISRKEVAERGGIEPSSSSSPTKTRKESSGVAKLPSIHVTNFNAQKTSATNLGKEFQVCNITENLYEAK